MKTTLCLIPSLLFITGVLQYASAQAFSENFNSYTAGQPLPYGAAPHLWNAARYNGDGTSADSGLTSEITQDSSDLFGEGTSNNYLTVGSSSTTGNFVYDFTNSFSGGQVGQLTLSFDQQNDFSVGANGSYGLLFRLGNGSSSTNSAFVLGLFTTATGKEEIYAGTVNPGVAVTAYSLDTLYTLTLDYNNSTSTVSYAGGTIAPGTMDIYLNGVLVGNDVAANSSGPGTGVSMSTFEIAGKTDFTGSLAVDDITVGAIPEPSSTALLLLGMCGAMALARFRLKTEA